MTEQEIQTIKQRYGIVGTNVALTREIETAVQVAPTKLSVLITGENGVGKEHFPKIIHDYSSRKHGKFLSVNCGAIPEGTIDSELFGHIKGSFTGALTDRKGYFEQADGGTLFLDEVGELPLTTQTRLLRVLETGEFIRVGESEPRKTNVRVVAATNVNLPQAIANNRFREDLFYRLCAVEIRVPALRDRREDIPLLFRKFASDFAAQNTGIPVVHLTEQAKELLMSFPFPGNIRQLKNIAEQVSVMQESREISADMLRPFLREAPAVHTDTYGLALRGNQGPRIYSNPNGIPHDASEMEWVYQALNVLRQEVASLRQEVDELRNGAPVTHNDHIVALTEATPISHIRQEEKDNFQPAEEVAQDPIHIPEEDKAVTLEQSEKNLIREALRRNSGIRKLAAEELHISERTLYRKIKNYDL